jgi:uncharacterized membrane protein YkvI
MKKMTRFKINVSHFTIMISCLILWFFCMMGLLELFGIVDDVRLYNLPLLTNVIIISSMITTFIFFMLSANLLSYTVMARLLKIQRHDLEDCIKEHAVDVPLDNMAIAQKFYAWCLDVAYR